MPFWLSQRRLQPERMDDPALPRAQHEQALAGLARINALSRSDAILWPTLDRLARGQARPLRVLDVASGAGDVLFRLEARARRAQLAIEWTGTDLSPVAVDFATREAARRGSDVRFVVADALTGPPLPEADVACSSLFLHHLETDTARTFLGRLHQAGTRCVLVNDLRRGRLAWVTAWLVTRLVTRSPIVHYDGPVSVGGAFTPGEALALAREAGWIEPRVRRCWPFRFLLSSERA